MHRIFLSLVLLAALLGSGGTPAIAAPAATQPTLTFLVWSDQHVTRDGDASLLTAPVDAMNSIAGKPYPPDIGGQVETPQFVLGVGDCVDWPTAAAVKAYERATDRLHFPRYDLVGNHDEGADDRLQWIVPPFIAVAAGILAMLACGWLPKPPRPRRRKIIAAALAMLVGFASFLWFNSQENLMARWITRRHGATSYVFDRGGIHFIAIFSAFNPRQIITPAALQFIRAELAKVPKTMPVIIATHYCYEAIGNKDEFVDALGDANVILIIGGHYHYATVNQYRGRNFLQVASPVAAPKFTVIRITPQRVQAIPYDFKTGQWATTAVLDVARQ